MSNVSDYLKWRGDLDFSQAPFNDVDNLILAQIAYVDFTDIVPAPGSMVSISSKTVLSAISVSLFINSGSRGCFLIPMMRRRLRNANLS